jgi:hypothetical protein
MRINKGTRAKKAKSTSVKKAPRKAGAFSTRAVVAGVACFLGAAMIIGASASSRPSQVARADAPSDYALEMAKKTSGSRMPAADAEIAGTSGYGPDMAADGDSQTAIPPAAPPVTITGCLERDDDSFRLKNTSGADAPKARSWKSGFMKKGSASVDLVNPPKKLRLSDHVGERVSLTGVMVDRDMQVRSLNRVAASCN